MSRYAYVNGRYRRHAEAAVHIEDRGYQFADGVYEVIAVRHGALVDEAAHLDRLGRSLAALRIAPPLAERALGIVIRQVLTRNRVDDGSVYIQITRAVAPRDHGFPTAGRSQLVVTARHHRPPGPALTAAGVSVISVPDQRWRRPDIKSIALLPNVLAKQLARESGAYEAWLIDGDGFVTEGAASNAWIVSSIGELVTRPAGSAILNGITRRVVMGLARDHGMNLVERPFTLAEALAGREAFLTSTTSAILPVVRIDGRLIGDGTPGVVTRALLERYQARLERAS